MRRNMGGEDAVRRAYAALQAGDFAGARDISAPWVTEPAGALLYALGRSGAGDVEAGAAALSAIARRNPGAQHPAIDLAEMLQQHGQDPVPHLRAALRQAPGDVRLMNALAGALVEVGPIEEAVLLFEQVVALQAGNGGAWSNLGKALAAVGRFENAEAAFGRAVTLSPGHTQIRLNQGVATLKAGRLAEGWGQLKARHALPGRPAPPPGPELLGLEGVAGCRVLLLHNEGYGDTLQFIRYAPMLEAAGARPIALVPPQLRRLLRFNGIDVVEGAVPAYDCWCHISDLPAVFGTTLHTVPGSLPYLRADPALVAQFVSRLPPGRRVGLVWAGEARLHDAGAASTDRLRSLDAGQLGPLLEVPGVAWISLQHGRAPPAGVFDAMAGVVDFAETAAIIAGLEMVVSVDTSVAHLAGAMGIPVLLLDRFDNCWRWLSGREDSPWYPGVLRIVRQERPGDWAGVLARAAAMVVGDAGSATLTRPSPASGRGRRDTKAGPDFDGLDGFGDVVDAEDAGAAVERHEGRGDGAGGAALRVGFVGQHADGVLAGDAGKKGAAKGEESRQALEEFTIMFGRLREAEAGVEHDGTRVDAGGSGGVKASGELGGDLGSDVVVGRQAVHGGGGAAHVHEDNGAAAGREEGGGCGVVGQRADIVDDSSADVQSAGHRLGVAGVDGNGRALLGECGDDRENAGLFDTRGHWRGAGAGAFAADVQDGGALFQHAFGAGNGHIGVEVVSAVAEAVGRDVQDTHDVRTGAESGPVGDGGCERR